MAIRKINSRSLGDTGVATADIADGSITTAKLAADAVTTPKIADGAVTGAKAVNLGRRNLIINGAMQVAQRGTSTTGVTDAGYYVIDRMNTEMTNGASGTHTISQSSDAPSGFLYSYKINCTTAEASPNQLRFEHRIEGYNLTHLEYNTSSAKQLTLSFWVKSNVTGTYAFSIETTTYERYFNTTYTIDSANTWEYKTISIAGDTASALNSSNGLGLDLSWWLTAPTSLTASGTPDTWVTQAGYTSIAEGHGVNMASSTSNEWFITGVQLEVGDTATPFEHRSYGEELQLCKRYYEKIGNWGNTNGYYQMCVYRSRANSMGFQIQYTVEKRVDNPSVTWYSPDETTTGSIYRISDGGGSSIAIQFGPSGDRHGVYRTQHSSNPASPVDSGYSAKLTVECEL